MTKSLFLKWKNKVILVLATVCLVACGNFKFTGTSPVDFGDVLVFTSSPPKTLTWQNIGTAHEVLGGKAEPSPAFALVGTFSAVTVALNTNVSLQYSFTPQVPGSITGEAKLITSRMSGRASSDKVVLKGKGVFYFSDGNITISETAGGGAPAQAVDFGKIPKGMSKTMTVFVKNTPPAGTPAAAVATTVNWSLNNRGFASAPAHGEAFNIPANTPTAVTVTFTPPDVGVYEDSVTFKDATGKIVTGIMVKGEGVQSE